MHFVTTVFERISIFIKWDGKIGIEEKWAGKNEPDYTTDRFVVADFISKHDLSQVPKPGQVITDGVSRCIGDF